ncbi:hypothetical protein BOX15_Mlig034389g2 [Macrostomum lignano]|uniref:RING-type domain-containing protein n=1 Tax=Macrostomum lignano TaxID=282301 RepID=A0A267GNR8_9PLAT|nr:hypothetical protein BOX15_Mlig034389g2 [Macrostomum lignano]
MQQSRLQSRNELCCTICGEKFDSTTDCVILTGCKHVFHNCVYNWLRRSPTCPICRRPAQLSTVERAYFSSIELEQAQATGSISVPLTDESLSQLVKAMDIEELEKMTALEQLSAANQRNAALLREIEKLRVSLPAAHGTKVALQAPLHFMQQSRQSNESVKRGSTKPTTFKHLLTRARRSTRL